MGGLPKLDFAILPIRHEEKLPTVELALDTARITSLALSVGTVWWAAHVGGMLASLLASAPAWRHVDPLPLLGRDESEPGIDWHMPEKDPPEEETSEAELFGANKAADSR